MPAILSRLAHVLTNTQKVCILCKMFWASKSKVVLLISLLEQCFGASGLFTDCLEDYSPCLCIEQDTRRSVVCNGIEISEVNEVFKRTTSPVIYSLELNLLPDDQTLTRDLLSHKLVEKITIRGTDRDYFNLAIDIGSFTATKDYTRDLEISNCNIATVNFGFLQGFLKLESFSLSNVSSVRLMSDLPELPSLQRLHVRQSKGFGELTSYTFRNYSQLEILELPYNEDIDDVILSFIMLELSISPLKESIRYLDFNGNHLLTQVPTRTAYFPKLDTVLINSNSIQLLETASVAFINNSAVATFSIQNNNLTFVQPGAFVGDFSGAKIHLDCNNLSDFPANVYQYILEEMEKANIGGYISLQSNPFNCDCGLAWLIAHNRNLLERVVEAKCAGNGESFQNLSSEAYMNC